MSICPQYLACTPACPGCFPPFAKLTTCSCDTVRVATCQANCSVLADLQKTEPCLPLSVPTLRVCLRLTSAGLLPNGSVADPGLV